MSQQLWLLASSHSQRREIFRPFAHAAFPHSPQAREDLTRDYIHGMQVEFIPFGNPRVLGFIPGLGAADPLTPNQLESESPVAVLFSRDSREVHSLTYAFQALPLDPSSWLPFSSGGGIEHKLGGAFGPPLPLLDQSVNTWWPSVYKSCSRLFLGTVC